MKNTDKFTEMLYQEIEKLRSKTPLIQAAIGMNELFLSLAENIKAVSQSANYIEQLNLIRNISKKFVEVHDLNELAQYLLTEARSLIPFTDGSIGLVNEGIIKFPIAIGKNKDSVMAYEIPVGKGLTGWVVSHQISQNIGNTRKDKRYRGQIKDTKSELDVPIIYGHETLGVINIESSDFEAFSDNDVYLLETLADAAAIAIKNIQFSDQIKARTSIIERLTSTLEYSNVLELILETISELVECTEASVGVVNAQSKKINFTIAKGPSKMEVEEYEIDIKKGLTGWAVRKRQSVRVNDVRKDKRYEKQILKTRSELDIPLVFAGKVIGVLNAESPNIAAFTNEDQKTLEDIAPYAALALRHSTIYNDIKRKLDSERQLRNFSEMRAVIGDVSGNTAHDVNGKVALIRIDAEELTSHHEDLVSIKAKQILKYVNDITALIEDFQKRRDNVLVKPDLLSVNDVLLTSINTLKIPTNIKIVNKLSKDLKKCFIAKQQLTQVFQNLINNALNAMPEGGKLQIESYNHHNNILVRVKDTGVGIPEEYKDLIFEDKFTKSSTRKGMGFGLSWSRLFVNSFGGKIELEYSEVGKGAIFNVILPISIIEETEIINNEVRKDG